MVFISLNIITIIFYRGHHPNLEDQVSVSMSPSDMVAQLYSQVPVSLSITLYNSQGYGGGILARLHKGSP
jgi:hypothetical protein